MCRLFSFFVIFALMSNSSWAGEWKTIKEIDPIDDLEYISIILENNSDELVDATLIIMCNKNKVLPFIFFDYYLGIGPTVDVRHRFDDHVAESGQWTTLEDHRHLIPDIPANIFILRLLSCDKYMVEISPPNNYPAIVSFDVSGLADALESAGGCFK